MWVSSQTQGMWAGSGYVGEFTDTSLCFTHIHIICAGDAEAL